MDLFLIPIFFSLLLVLILIPYLVPLDIAFSGSIGNGEPGARMKAIWGFLGLKSTWQGDNTYYEILLAGHQVMCWEAKAIKESRRAPQKREAIRFLPMLNAIPAVWPKIQRILITFRDSISLRNLDCEVVYGSGDPVMTGMLFGFYCAVVLPILPYGNAVSVGVNPVFDRETLKIRLDFRLRLVRPLRFFITAAALLLTKDSREALQTLSSGGAR